LDRRRLAPARAPRPSRGPAASLNAPALSGSVSRAPALDGPQAVGEHPRLTRVLAGRKADRAHMPMRFYPCIHQPGLGSRATLAVRRGNAALVTANFSGYVVDHVRAPLT